MRWLAFFAAVLAALGVALHSARANDSTARNLILGSAEGGTQPQNMEEFLTAVTQDVDAYWTTTFEAANLPEPRVTYHWIPAGQTAASACDGEGGAMGAGAAAYCPSDDTIYISEQFASGIYTGSLDDALPGSANGYGRTIGDFAVAYIVAHEYGHQIQNELGLFERGLPTVALELQADCFAGTWARSAESKLEDGDIQEALDAALAVGDFQTDSAGHHGTPEQRKAAWTSGFEAGDPSACNDYVSS